MSSQLDINARLLARALRENVNDFEDCLAALHKQQTTETIHQYRVKTRRLISALLILNNHRDCKKLSRQARQSIKSFNQIRDMQVLQLRFADHSELLARLQQAINIENAKLEQQQSTVDTPSFKEDLNTALVDFVKFSHSNPKQTRKEIAHLWKDSTRQVQERIDKLDRKKLKTFHKLRLKYKRLRYLVETLNAGDSLKDINLETLKYWQDLLGNIQDADVALQWLGHIDGTQIDTSAIIVELKEEIARACKEILDNREKFSRFVHGL